MAMLEKAEDLFIGFVAQKAIIEVDGKVLFVKSIDPTAKWDLPGGRIHKSETPEEGLVRELYEELGVDCAIGRVVSVKRFLHDKNPTPFYFVGFAVSINEPRESIVIPADELSAQRWFERSELVESEVYANCIEAVDEYFAQKL